MTFARFEEEDVVAIVQVGEFVELRQLRFGVELGVFATVWEEGVQVGEEMAMSDMFLISSGSVGEPRVSHTEMSRLWRIG